MMKEITLVREIRSNRAILGRLYDGPNLLGVTLERPYLENKPNISSIPVGYYECSRSLQGKFQWWKLLHVGGRDAIEIHEGNVVGDSKGCILIGKDWTFMDRELAITASKATLKSLLPILGDKFILKIINGL